MTKEEILHSNSVVESTDKWNGKTVSELVEKKGSIFNMVKKGYMFDDEVLSSANISHSTRDHHAYYVISDHEKDTKKYKKETASLKEIIEEISTLEHDDYKEEPEVDEEAPIETDYAELQ